MKRVGFYTLGCKVNQYETQAMMELFKNSGYEIVDFEDTADAYVINTCTVTSFGYKKSRQVIRRARKTNPESVIAVVGCYSQIAPEEVEEIEGVNVIAGTGERAKIVELVEEAFNGSKVKEVIDIMKQREFEETGFITCNEKTRAFLKIQEGCNNFCSYCIIPYARGPIRSRKIDSILKEITALAEKGFKEVVLTGIHLSSYGKDLGDISLIDVIDQVSKIEGIERIRLGSLEPGLITNEFIGRIKENKKLCPHFHISLQSGCDTVLKRMNRKYTTQDYESKIQLLRDNIPDVAVTTDVMVGFPGETDEEFDETYRFLDKISFSKMHVFKYSPRRNTPAAKFPNQISIQVKEERSNLLLAMSDKKEREFQEKFLGREMKVLFEEEKTENGSKVAYGHTANFIHVSVKEFDGDVGSLKKTKLTAVKNGIMAGTIVD